MKKFYILFSIIMCSNLIYAQWSKLNGPFRGRTYCIEHVGNEIWTGSTNGVYTSGNEGLTWSKSSLINGYCFDMVSEHDTTLILYNIYYPDTFCNWVSYSKYSINGGVDWSQSNYAFTPTGIFYKDLIKVQNAYIFGCEGTYWITYDLGLHWAIFNYSPNERFEYLFKVDDKKLVAYTMNTQTYQYKYYISYDAGHNWQLIYNLQSNELTSFFYKDSVFFLIDENYVGNVSYNKLLRSTNYGTSWDSVFAPPTGISIGTLLFKDDSICMLTNKVDTFYYSLDNGVSWLYTSSKPSVNYTLGDTVNISNGDYLETSVYDGIIRHNVSQDTVFTTTNGLGIYNVLKIKSNNGRLYASDKSSVNGKNLYFSDDDGNTWKPILLPDTNLSCTVIDFCFSGDSIFILSVSKLFRSFDNGYTWDYSSLDTMTSYTEAPSSVYFFNGRLYLSGSDFWYSDNVGNTWNKLDFNFVPQAGSCAQDIMDSSGVLYFINNNLFTLIDNYKVFKYNPISGYWDIITCDIDDNCFQVVDSILVGKDYWTDSLMLSFDYGLTWSKYLIQGLPLNEMNKIKFPSKIISINGAWFGMAKNRIYTSLDYGKNWQLISDSTIFQVQDFTSMNGNLYVGAYCNSVWKRAGAFYTVSGAIYRDNNQNGIFDAGEQTLSNVVVSMRTAGIASVSDTTGHYNIISDAVGDTLAPTLPINCSSVTPDYYILNGPETNKNFGVYIAPNIADLKIDLTNIGVFAPGFETNLKLTITNLGSLIQAPNITLMLDSSLTFISSSISPNSFIGNVLSWNLDSVDFMESKEINVLVQLSSFSSLNDTVKCKSEVDPILTDVNPNDNISELNEIIVGSYDPNDKTCKQGTFITPQQVQNGEELEYTIRFQNTGTYQATNINVIDTLSSFLDYSSFHIISSSHPVQVELSGNTIAKFVFNNINLSSSEQDEINSHGFVKYGIKCKSGVSYGDAILNNAFIYFDFNQPIKTNTTTTVISSVNLLHMDDTFKKNNPTTEILVFPNPTSEMLNVRISGINVEKLKLFISSNTGELIKSKLINENNFSIDVSDLKTGIYWGIILTKENKKVATFKFIRKSY